MAAYKSISGSGFELLATDFVCLNKNWNYKNITSTFYRLYYIEEGAGTLFNAEWSVKLESGRLYLVPSFTNCNYCCDDYMNQYYICFTEASADGSSLFSSNRKLFEIPATDQDISAIKRVLALNPRRNLKTPHNPKVYEKSKVISDYHDQNKMLGLPAYIETCGLLLQLIARFMRAENFLQANPRAVNSRVADAIYFIQTNLQHPITVQTLAGRANRNPSYFSRLFFEETGELPLAYLQKIRIARAQLLLSTTDMAFSEIAVQTGFESLSYFSRIFKKISGQTPGEYKHQNLWCKVNCLYLQ